MTSHPLITRPKRIVLKVNFNIKLRRLFGDKCNITRECTRCTSVCLNRERSNPRESSSFLTFSQTYNSFLCVCRSQVLGNIEMKFWRRRSKRKRNNIIEGASHKRRRVHRTRTIKWNCDRYRDPKSFFISMWKYFQRYKNCETMSWNFSSDFTR